MILPPRRHCNHPEPGTRKGSYMTRQILEYAIGPTPLGLLLLAQSPRGVCAVQFGDSASALLAELQGLFPAALLQPGGVLCTQRLARVATLLREPLYPLALPLDLQGTAFQQRVWQALRSIPAGQPLSYRELAARIGTPSAVRAVASACAANRIALLIPCHRVIRSDGSLSGYRWGVQRKQRLLALEARVCACSEGG